MTKHFIAFFFALFMVAMAKSQSRKIIDVHFHTRSAGDYGTPPPPNPVSGKAPHASSNEEIYKANLSLQKSTTSSKQSVPARSPEMRIFPSWPLPGFYPLLNIPTKSRNR